MKIIIKKESIEKHRTTWENVARNNNWDIEGKLHIQIWVDKKTGDIKDSVSFHGLKNDLVCDYEKDKVLIEGKHFTIG